MKKWQNFGMNTILLNMGSKLTCVDFEVELEDNQSLIYCGIDNSLSQKIFSRAEKKGVPPRDLVNLWLEQKLKEEQVV
jgi:hypothetical protein